MPIFGAVIGQRTYDIVISSQLEFNAIIERVAANQYKIKDDIRSVFGKVLSGGYLMSGGTSPLSGGDTWGYIETNDCKVITFEPTASIHFGNTQGYIRVNSAGCRLSNVTVEGTNTVASAIVQSFLLAANRVAFDNCRVFNRLSNVEMYGFKGSGTAKNNETGRYDNCEVEALDGSGVIHAFRDCWNITNGHVRNIDSTGSHVQGYQACENLATCMVTDIETSSGVAYGFENCERLSSCYAEDITTSGTLGSGFSLCNNLASCVAENVSVTAGTSDVSGFIDCTKIVGSKALTISNTGTGDSYGFKGTDCCSGCEAKTISANGGDAYGFFENQGSACLADDISATGTGEATGFVSCYSLSACTAIDIDTVNGNAMGFNFCFELSGCRAEDVDSSGADAIGFLTCTQVSASRAFDIASAGGDAFGFSFCDRISACYANQIDYSGVGANNARGFDRCDVIGECYSTDVDVGGAGVASGFFTCTYGSSLFTDEAVNAGNNFIDTADAGAVIATDFSSNDNWT
jgi:hypothetical protein